ncbi:hypothetical protein [Legionella drancourtii]|uniref:Lipocalin-like domain-containing protein n=1 Tax=Legionella drancourtii LLAP12 TaxID=658187 RepID=G9EL07_9GAMM|nr:hypothetical protein [Legionella drancourtii]EHL32049.1 hypothetical protein LDG_5903 [Legionella drancourtii LLAP12]
MKKLAILISSMVLAANTFAFTLQHKHKNDRLHMAKATQINESEDFSGIWIGNCDDEDVELTITQNDKKITLAYPEDESSTFELNNLVSHNNSTPSFSESSMQHAAIFGNRLNLIFQGITTGYDSGSYNTLGSVYMNVWITKDGDTLTIEDMYDESESCVLKKSN